MPTRANLLAGVQTAWRSRLVRATAGVALSAVFFALVLARVDLAETASALVSAAPAGVAMALVLVLIELAIRAERWRFLLLPSTEVPHRLAFAYLNIGYLANAVLPARLGDAARAVLAGGAFGISRLTTLGTIVVERVFDAAVILLVVVVAGLTIARGAEITGAAVVFGAAVLFGLAVIIAAGVGVLRSGRLPSRWEAETREVTASVARGAAALRSADGFLAMTVLTFVAFGVGVVACTTIVRAIGIELGPAQAAVFLGLLALSTALPAAPGSFGTYEFVGVATLGALGADPSQALAATLLVHAIAWVPPSLIGLGATLVLHIRMADLERASLATLGPADA